MLYDAPPNRKAFRLTIGMIMGMTFFNLAAILTDKEFSQMTIMRMIARNKGI
jgi:hypothetical protein